ncbi:MAG: hypothetical protein U1G07_10895 [Verrucomicrobiota bacterium]
MSPIWGWLFDRMNFFALRITLNIGFAIGILAFFTSTDSSGLLLGAIVSVFRMQAGMSPGVYG